MIRYAILIICFLLPPSYAESLKESREDAFFTQAGDVMQIALPLSAAGYSLAIWDTEGLKQYTYSFGATMLAAYALKYSVGRPRPYQNPDERGHSFPSGHTAAAFSGASYLQKRYGWRIGGPAYAAAAAVGYSRVWSRNHYLTDVLAGAAIATTFSYVFTKPYDGKKEAVQAACGANGNGGYLSLSMKF